MNKLCVLALCIACVSGASLSDSMGGMMDDLASKVELYLGDASMGDMTMMGGMPGKMGNFTVGMNISKDNMKDFMDLIDAPKFFGRMNMTVPGNFSDMDKATRMRMDRMSNDMGHVMYFHRMNMIPDMLYTIENNTDLGMVLARFLGDEMVDGLQKLSQARDIMDFGMIQSSDDFKRFVDMAGSMDMDTFDEFKRMKDDPRNADTSDMYMIPTSMFGYMKGDTLRNMSRDFSNRQMDDFCMTIGENADSDTVEHVLANVDCMEAYTRLRNTGEFELPDDMQDDLLSNAFGGRAPDQYTDNDWASAITNNVMGGFNPDDIMRMPASVMKSNLGALAGQMGEMDEDSMGAFFDEMGDAFNYDMLGAADFGNMRGMLNDMPMEDLDKIPPATKIASLGSFKNMEFDDEVAMEFYEDIQDTISIGDWTPETFDNAFEFMMYDSDMMDQLPASVLFGKLEDLGARDFDEDEAIAMGERMLKDPQFSSPSTMDASAVSRLGTLMAGMPLTFIQDLPVDAVVSSLMMSNMSRADMGRAASRKMLDKVMSKIGSAQNLNGTLLKKLGKMMKGLSATELNMIPTEDFYQALPALKDVYEDMDTSLRAAVMDKAMMARATVGDMILAEVGPFFQDIAASDAMSMDMSKMNLTNPNVKKPPKFNISQDTARHMFEKVKLDMGTPSATNANFSMKMWRNLGQVVCGMSCDDIRDLPLNNMFPSIMKVLSDQKDDCLDDVQLRCIAKKIRGFIWNNVTMSSQVEKKMKRDVVKQLARFLPYFNTSDLEMFGKKACQDVVAVIGKFPLYNLPRNDLVSLKQFAMKCRNKTADSPLMDSDLRTGGDILCGLEIADINKIDRKAFKNRVKSMSERCSMPADVGQAFMNKAMEHLNIKPENMTSKYIVKLGPLMAYMDTTQINKVNKTHLRKAAPRMKKAVMKFQKKLEKKMKMGMEAADPTMTDGLAAVFGKVAEAYIEKRAAGSSSSGRRKRATSTLTCTDLKNMGTGVTSLTTDQLNLANSEFTNCADFLGAQSGFSTAQKSQLTTVAKNVWGAVSTWTSSNIALSGVIAQGLTDAEIGQLALTTTDAVNGIAMYTGWTSSQITAGADRYIAAAKSGSGAALTSMDLKALSNFGCGLSTSTISGLGASIYAGAAREIGQVTTCSQSVLTAWAAHAKTTYGSTVTAWTSSTIATVGSVIGGLSSNEIASLSTSQLEAVSSTTISSLPSSSFASLTTAQMSGLSTAQASSVTSAQKSSLSTEQLAAVNANAATIVVATTTTTTASTPGGNGAGNVAVNVLLSVVMVAAAMLL